MKDKIYIHYGSKQYSDKLFEPIKNAYFIKPAGGLWASAIDDDSGWKQWNEIQGYTKCKEENAFKFQLSDNARILKLRNVHDLLNLPKNNDFIIKSRYFENFLDFEAIMKQYDVIDYKPINGLYDALYGWDCDSILVMNKNVIKLISEENKNGKN